MSAKLGTNEGFLCCVRDDSSSKLSVDIDSGVNKELVDSFELLSTSLYSLSFGSMQSLISKICSLLPSSTDWEPADLGTRCSYMGGSISLEGECLFELLHFKAATMSNPDRSELSLAACSWSSWIPLRSGSSSWGSITTSISLCWMLSSRINCLNI